VASADVFTVLADPTRRRLVEVLHGRECSVGDLVAEVDIHQPGVSRHLRILNDAGFVRVRADGQRRLYSLRSESMRQLDAWVAKYAHDQKDRLQRLSDLIDERKTKK
jgi:DNA-binding transcriptional ArsR family regulator